MSFVDYLILIQNVILFVIVSSSTWILCKGKKKAGPGGGQTPNKSKESLLVKSEIKPAITDPTPSMLGKVKEEPKVDGSKDGEKKASQENKEGGDGGGEGAKKEGDEKKDGGGSNDPKSKEPSLKPFPKFEMPTESKKKKKIAENEVDKKAKMSAGFYQEKSDEDDTLEKVDSLRVEQSDKTKRSQKKKK